MDPTSLLTIILIVITAYYAWQTHKTVKEMQLGRKMAMVPVLKLDVSFYDSVWDGFGFSSNYGVWIQNVGNSPAFETTVEIKLTNQNNANAKNIPIFWKIDIIPANEKTLIRIERKEGVVLGSYDPQNIEIIGRCKNSFNIETETIATFTLAEKKDKPFNAVGKDKVDWAKGKETFQFVKALS
jgi:hypothetical protein